MTEFAPAVLTNAAIVLALAGASGSGKTKSALELAVGLAGERGRIFGIDSEGRRMLYYADDYKFLHAEWRPPFTPESLAGLLKKAAQQGAAVIIVDSMSDEMEGEGGLQEMADAEFDEQVKRGWEPNRAAAWAKPKARHKKQIIEWVRHEARCHVIFCIRAEEKVKFEKVTQGGKSKTVVVPVGWQPVCEKRLPYEMLSSFLFTPDNPGFPKWLKTYSKIYSLVPLDRQMSRETGKRLAEWAAGGGTAIVPPGRVDPSQAPAPLGETEHQRPTVGLGRAGGDLQETGHCPVSALPPTDTDALRDDLNWTAESKASEGSDEFKAWWKELPRHERDLIRGMLGRYEGMAREADDVAGS